MGSARLPGKMLFDLAGAPLVLHVIERVQRAKKIDTIVVAFPGTKDNQESIGQIATRCGVWPFWYEGDENDLVGRYLSAAEGFAADLIVRIPCDNAMPDPVMIDAAVDTYLSTPSIYVSTMYYPVSESSRVYVDGVGAEVFSMSRLKWLDHATRGQKNYREHPHLLFQDHHLIDGWEQYQRYANHSETIRLDVNSMDDYLFVKDIYDHFGRNDFTTAEVLAYLESKT